jgi:hypothetical protein
MDKYFLFCSVSPPNEDQLADGDNVCYVIGNKDFIQEEYQNALTDCEFPFIFMGRVLEEASQTYERTEYGDETPV